MEPLQKASSREVAFGKPKETSPPERRTRIETILQKKCLAN